MATEQYLNQLKSVASRLKEVDKEKLLRSTLGEESLELVLTPKLDEITKKVDLALEYAPYVSDNTLSQVINIFSQIQQNLMAQSQRSSAEYIAQRSSFLTAIDSDLEQLLNFWPPFVTAAIERRGFLQDEGIQKEYQRIVDAIKAEANVALQQVKDEASKTIEEAKKLAQQIEDKARLTAAHISVEEAQRQFQEAQDDYNTQVKIWSALSGLSIVAFILLAYYLVTDRLPEEWKWHVIYYTAVRLTILTAVGAVATFCLRVLRAYMHMRQHNLHRQRVANSIAAFVESAITPEQRDLILSQLVDAVVSFGHSGLLPKEDDTLQPSKMTIDSITRTFTPPTKS